MQKRYFTLTSPAGHFIFDTTTRLSHAKLIRDAITGSFHGALRMTPSVSPTTAVRWVREHLAGPVANAKIDFEWVK